MQVYSPERFAALPGFFLVQTATVSGACAGAGL